MDAGAGEGASLLEFISWVRRGGGELASGQAVDLAEHPLGGHQHKEADQDGPVIPDQHVPGLFAVLAGPLEQLIELVELIDK